MVNMSRFHFLLHYICSSAGGDFLMHLCKTLLSVNVGIFHSNVVVIVVVVVFFSDGVVVCIKFVKKMQFI